MSQLPLSLIVTVSVSQLPAGLGQFNVNNVMLFSDDIPVTPPSGGFSVYSGPEGVATDYGSSSQTAKMAAEIFAQTPNILAGGGELIVAPLLQDLGPVTAVQAITFSAVPASGNWELTYLGSETTGSMADNISAANVQVALRLLAGLSTVTVTGNFTTGFIVTFTGVTGPVPNLTVTANTLEDSGSVAITTTVLTTTPGIASGSSETMINAILRLQPLVSFCGVIKTNTWVVNEIMDAALYVQSQNLIMGVQSATGSDADVTTGILWQIQNAGLDKTRCTQYLQTDYNGAGAFLAGYFGRGFCVDFSGTNTVINMQLKTIAGIVADGQMDEEQWDICQAAGVDTYPSIQGVAKVSTSGKNRFFDQVYNKMWLTTDIQISVFNVMAETPTKIPQTDQGVGQLVAGVSQVFAAGVTSGYLAPGQWSGGTFANQADFLRNITTVGYYIFAPPVALQSQADREARKAPLIQSAGKEAGGVNTASIQVNIVP